MPTLRIDLHTHLKVAKRCALRPGEGRRFAATLRERGLHALAITEHFHAPGFWAMYEALLAEFPYRRGRFEVDGALFFTGAELTLAEHTDVVLLSTLADLMALDEAFPTPLSAGHHPSAAELNEALRRTGSLAVRVAAHPFREGKGIENIDPADAAELFHAAEINARFCDRAAQRGAAEFAHSIAGAVVGGSDAHVHTQVGAAWTEIEFPARASVRPLIADTDETPLPLAGEAALGEGSSRFARLPVERILTGAAARRATPDVSFEDLRDALLSPAPERIEAALHPDAERLCAEGAALKASLKASLPKIGLTQPEYA